MLMMVLSISVLLSVLFSPVFGEDSLLKWIVGEEYGERPENSAVQLKGMREPVIIRQTFGSDEGFAPVRGSDKWGYIDTKGNIVSGMKYDSVSYFGNGYAAVSLDRKYGMIDKNMNAVTTFTYDKIYPSYNGSKYPRFVFLKDGKRGIVDEKEKVISTYEAFEQMSEFREGLAVFRDLNAYGIIDIDGKILVSGLQQHIVYSFSGGRAMFEYVGYRLSGYIDVNGQVVIPTSPISYWGNFKDGLGLVAPVQNWENIYALIDRDGNALFTKEFTKSPDMTLWICSGRE